MDKPVPLDQFVEETAKAKVDTFLPEAEKGLRATGRDLGEKTRDFAAYQITRMRDFVLELYGGTSSERTFADTSGGAVDCMPREKQPTALAARKHGHVLRKPPAGSVLAGKKTPLGPDKKDPFGTQKVCPDGTVPWKRVTLDTLAKFGTLEEYFGRQPDGKSGVDGRPGEKGFWDAGHNYYHRHATVDSTGGPFYGCQGWFNLWAPNPSPGVFSLSQLWLVRELGGAWTGSRQTIESGWQVYPEQARGSGLPYLFVFFNPDNYGPRSGYLVNRFGEGFIYHDNPGWTIGSPLDPDLVTGSEDPNAQMGIMMRWTSYENGDWELWIGVNEDELQAVGYIPGGLYGSGASEEPFEKLSFGGEVSGRQENLGPMGSAGGRRPTGAAGTDFGRCAFIKYLSAQFALGADFDRVDDFQLTHLDEHAGYFCTLDQLSEWGTYIFFGGPQ